MAAGILERWVTGLVGAAFAIRVFDSTKPWWARVGYGLVGYDLLVTAWEDRSLFAGAQSSGLVARPTGGDVLKFAEVKVGSIDERVTRVHEQMLQGTRDPVVYKLAREVLAKKGTDGQWLTPEKDPLAEITAMFFEVKKRVRYTWDPLDYDAFQTPAKTLNIRNGDCDDMWSLLGAMLRSIGYKVRSRIVRTSGNATWNHIYGLVQLPGTQQWMPLDLTVNQPPGWEVPKQYVQETKDFDVVEKGDAARALPSATATTSSPMPAAGTSF